MKLLLAPGVDRDAIDRAALEAGWPLLNIFARTPTRPRQVIFGDAEWLITFVWDHRVDARYAVLDGHDVEALSAQLRAALPTLSVDDVLARLVTDRVRALSWLGIVGPSTPDVSIHEILRRARASDAPRERDAATFSLQALGWS